MIITSNQGIMGRSQTCVSMASNGCQALGYTTTVECEEGDIQDFAQVLTAGLPSGITGTWLCPGCGNANPISVTLVTLQTIDLHVNPALLTPIEVHTLAGTLYTAAILPDL